MNWTRSVKFRERERENGTLTVGTAWSGVVCWETGLNCVAFLLPEELGIELALEMSIAWLMGLSWWGSASWWGVSLQTERS